MTFQEITEALVAEINEEIKATFELKIFEIIR